MRPAMVSAVNLLTAEKGRGWCVTIKSAPPRIASSTVVGVTVKQVISRRTSSAVADQQTNVVP